MHSPGLAAAPATGTHVIHLLSGLNPLVLNFL